MKASDAFPSKWIAASDLEGKNIRMTINRVEIEDVGDGKKPILYFNKAKKGLVLNKTNATALATAYGDEMDDWTGSEVILYPIVTDYKGKQVDAVRVRAPQPKDNPKPQATKPPAVTGPVFNDSHMPQADMDDSIPF